MERIITRNLLVKYLYREITPEEYLKLVEAAHNHPEIRRELKVLEQRLHALPKIELAPAERTVNRILDYSVGMQ